MTTQPQSLIWDDEPEDVRPQVSPSASIQAPAQAPAQALAQALAQAPAPVTEDVTGGADSPCVAICSTLFDDVCRGCGRSVMEVSNWVFMTQEEKHAVWVRIRADGYPRKP